MKLTKKKQQEITSQGFEIIDWGHLPLKMRKAIIESGKELKEWPYYLVGRKTIERLVYLNGDEYLLLNKNEN